MPVETLVHAVHQLQDLGVAFFNIEGGDPFLVYERLRRVCAAIDRRSEIWINSTGDGMTLERLKELKDLNLTAIMFSLHTADPAALNRFMHSDSAWDTMIQGIDLCHRTDIPVAFNTCITKEDFFNGEFEKIMEKAKELNGCLLQLIKPKPAGGRMDKGVETITPGDMAAIRQKIHGYNHGRNLSFLPSHLSPDYRRIAGSIRLHGRGNRPFLYQRERRPAAVRIPESVVRKYRSGRFFDSL